ncbi:MAG: hypothetical protein GX131_06995 [candidate division WS1 bacterium]|jgi:DNA topoisomerase IB|nr:hypothetical protein [candidate division WS1 bacterium]
MAQTGNYDNKYLPRPGSRPVYVYSEEWQECRDEAKYHRVALVKERLEEIREEIEELMRSRRPAERQLGAAAALIVKGAMRVGTGYHNTDTFGAQNIQKRHFSFVSDDTFRVGYIGKGGVQQEHEITDALLAETLRGLGAGKRSSKQVFPDLSYRQVLDWFDGFDLLPKDFRTWWADRLFRDCADQLMQQPLPEDERGRQEQVKREVNRVLGCIADMLGNTPDTTKASYVARSAIEDYEKARLSAKAK